MIRNKRAECAFFLFHWVYVRQSSQGRLQQIHDLGGCKSTAASDTALLVNEATIEREHINTIYRGHPIVSGRWATGRGDERGHVGFCA